MSLKEFENLQEGDRILFNNRKTPLTVAEVNKNSKIIEGPKKGVYELYLSDEEDLLVCRKGNRKYSSYVEELRKVGVWEKDEKQLLWTHSRTDAKLELSQNKAGYWSIKSNKFSVDQPLYGFNDLEVAKKELKEFLSNHPEG